MIIKINAQLEQAIREIKELGALEGEPQWATDLRLSGLVSARTLPLPSRQDENWRRTRPEIFLPDRQEPCALRGESLTLNLFPESSPQAEEALEGFSGLAGLKIPTQGEWDLNSQIFRQGGLLVGSLPLLFKEQPDLEKSIFKAEHPRRFLSSALISALRRGGVSLYAPAGVCAPQTLKINHQVEPRPDTEGSEQNLFCNHSLFKAEAQAQVSVVEIFQSPPETLQVLSFIEFELGRGAQVNYVLVSDWSQATTCLTTVHARLAADSSLKVVLVDTHSGATKTFFNEDLNGPNAKTEIYGLVFAKDGRRSEVNTFVHHQAPHTYSNVLVHCALGGDRARTLFAGNILVDPQAQQTDAYQKNQNLILSPGARAESMPKLEIIADDVRCTHGASFTNYDADQLFYLQSRGLSEVDAKRLLISGFFQEILAQVEDPTLLAWLSNFTQEEFTL